MAGSDNPLSDVAGTSHGCGMTSNESGSLL